MLSVARSTRHCDIAMENLIPESCTIGFYTKGSWSITDILKLNMKEYDMLIKEVEQIKKAHENEPEEN